jgi:predicted metal-binding membrane protein
VHECSPQDIATFLKLTNAAGAWLANNFADRIGRLIELRGNMADALFRPAAMPDILAELEVSDEANRRGVNVQVAQRLGAGMVQGIATSPIAALPRGRTVLKPPLPIARIYLKRASTF